MRRKSEQWIQIHCVWKVANRWQKKTQSRAKLIVVGIFFHFVLILIASVWCLHFTLSTNFHISVFRCRSRLFSLCFAISFSKNVNWTVFCIMLKLFFIYFSFFFLCCFARHGSVYMKMTTHSQLSENKKKIILYIFIDNIHMDMNETAPHHREHCVVTIFLSLFK